MDTLAAHMDDFRELIPRPVLALGVVVDWGELQLDSRGDSAKAEIIAECLDWWNAHTPTDPKRQVAWMQLGTCIAGIITSGKT